MVTPQIRQDRATLNHWTDVFFQSSTGYINVSNAKNFGKWYSLNDISNLITDTQGKPQQYLSINAFGVDPSTGRPRRTKSNLKQIRTLTIDIDQYTKGLRVSEVQDVLHSLVLDDKIPEPNLILTSRGVQLFYKIEGGASPKMEWLTHYITCRFIEYLADVGADSKASDATRLMRVPESINQKNGAVVDWEIWNDTAYPLDVLRKYTDVDTYRPPKPGGKRQAHVVTLDQVKHRNSLFYRTNHARIRDLELLFEIRGGVFTHTRNQFVYTFAYHYSLIFSSEHIVLQKVQALAENITSADAADFDTKEAQRTVKSAFEGARQFLDQYKADGHKVVYRTNDGIVKPKKSSTVIEELDITEDEQQQLNYLYGSELKRSKEAERVRKHYDLKGTMFDYNGQRKSEKKSLIKQIKKLKKEGLSISKIAKEVGKSRQRVSQLLKEV